MVPRNGNARLTTSSLFRAHAALKERVAAVCVMLCLIIVSSALGPRSQPVAAQLMGTWQVVAPGLPIPAFFTPVGLAVDAQGDVYIADWSADSVQKLSPDGNPVQSWGRSGQGPELLHHPSQVAVDARGTVFVVDQDNNRLQAFSSDGQLLVRPRMTSPPSSPGSQGVIPAGSLHVAADPRGRVYIFKTTPGGTSCRCDVVMRTFSASGQRLIQGRWSHQKPRPSSIAVADMAVDAKAHVYISVTETIPTGGTCGGENPSPCASETSFIQKRTLSGRLLAQWHAADNSNKPYQFGGISIDRGGNVLVVNTTDRPIVNISPVGKVRASWGTSGCGSGAFRSPSAVTTDEHGNIYVADAENGNVQKLSRRGEPVALWGGCGNTLFNQPRALAVDAVGNTFVTDVGEVRPTVANGIVTIDQNYRRILQISPAGQVLMRWAVQADGVALNGHGLLYVFQQDRITKLSLDGKNQFTYPLPDDEFGEPWGAGQIAIDGDGNIYVSSDSSGKIAKLSPTGHVLAVLTVPGYDASGSYSPALGIAIDPSGNLFALDGSRCRVVELSTTGKWQAGWGAAGSGPGQLSFSIDNPYAGIAVDGRGHVFVADTDNNRIQMFSTTGTFLQARGASGNASGVKAGEFNQPEGIAIDTYGNVYVSDTGNNRIQRLTPS